MRGQASLMQGGRNGPGTTPVSGWVGWQSPNISSSLVSSLSEMNISRESLSSCASFSQTKRFCRLESQQRSFDLQQEKQPARGTLSLSSRGNSTVGSPLSTSPCSPARSWSRTSMTSSPAKPRGAMSSVPPPRSHFPVRYGTARKLSDAEAWDLSLSREQRFNQFTTGTDCPVPPKPETRQSRILSRMESSPALSITPQSKFSLSPDLSFGLFENRSDNAIETGVEAVESTENSTGNPEGEGAKKKAFLSFSWNK